MIGAAPYRTLARQKGAQCFQLSIKQIYADEADEPEYDLDAKEILRTLPKEHHDWVWTFLKRRADELPPHRPGDHRIELQGELQPGYTPLYSMSQDELQAVKEYLRDNTSKGFIESSSAPFVSPVLFVKKADGGLRFCVDY
jgi:hypothetical protein